MLNRGFRRYRRLIIIFIVILACIVIWLLGIIILTWVDEIAINRLFANNEGGLWVNGYSSSLTMIYVLTRLGAIAAWAACLGQALYNILFKQQKNHGFIFACCIGLTLELVAALFILKEGPLILNTPPEIVGRYAHFRNEFYAAASGTLEALYLATMLRLSAGLLLSVSSAVFIVLNNRRYKNKASK